jgi:PKD repeat protein
MKKKIMKISFVFAIGVALLFGGAVTTNAEVITGLDPESGAATCPAGYGLEDFESGTDGYRWGGLPIASTIPGVSFVTTQGQDWWTGDWAAGYNGKYPSGAYTSGDQKWAWLGVSQGSGIINFTEGEASYVSVYTSTYSGVVLDAYADNGTFLASSGWASNNINTGKMTQLSISRPTADIGYVIVHDTGNYWLIDWLCTDAPGVPTPVNQPPVADINGPYVGDEGSPIVFDASGSSDPDGTVVLYEWDLDNDGQYDDATGVNPNYTWNDDYSGTIGLKVTDNDGLTDTDSTAVTVNNVAPTADAGGDQTVTAGDTVNFTGSMTDPGWLDTHTYEWDFDASDGIQVDATGQTPTYIYYDAGVYTVTLTVADDDGGVGTDTLAVTVNPIPATIDCDPDTLNLKSEGEWITCYIELPEGYGVERIAGEPEAVEVAIEEGELTQSQKDLLSSLVRNIDQAVASVEIDLEAEEGMVEYEVEGYLSPQSREILNSLIQDLRSQGNEVELSIKKEIDWENYKTLIDGSTVRLDDLIQAESDPNYGFVKAPELKDRNENGLPELMVKFDRAQVQALFPGPVDPAILTLTGKVFYNLGLADLEGFDTIRVIDKGNDN